MQRFTGSIAVLLLFTFAAMTATRKNVLILHEGSQLLPYQVLMAHELQKDLTSSPGLDVEIFEEYLDTWHIAKHSGAASCDVTLNYTHDRVTLEIEDHGSGFEPRGLKEKTGLGIESMRERLRSVGGTLRIDSAPLRGTKVRAEAPIVSAVPKAAAVEFDKATEGRPNVPAA